MWCYSDFGETVVWNEDILRNQLLEWVAQIDWSEARKDILPILQDPASIEGWSPTLFRGLVERAFPGKEPRDYGKQKS